MMIFSSLTRVVFTVRLVDEDDAITIHLNIRFRPFSIFLEIENAIHIQPDSVHLVIFDSRPCTFDKLRYKLSSLSQVALGFFLESLAIFVNSFVGVPSRFETLQFHVL